MTDDVKKNLLSLTKIMGTCLFLALLVVVLKNHRYFTYLFRFHDAGQYHVVFMDAWVDFVSGNFEDAESTCLFMLAENSDDEVKSRALYLLGQIQANTGRLDNAFISLLNAHRLFVKMGDHRSMFLTSLALAYVCILQLDFQNAEGFLEKAIDHNQKADQPLAYYWILKQKIAFLTHDFDKALLYSQNALEAYEENDDTWGMATSLGLTGLYLMFLGQMEDGLKAAKRAISISEVMGEEGERIYNQLPLIYYNKCHGISDDKILTEVQDWVTEKDDLVLGTRLEMVVEQECP